MWASNVRVNVSVIGSNKRGGCPLGPFNSAKSDNNIPIFTNRGNNKIATLQYFGPVALFNFILRLHSLRFLFCYFLLKISKKKLYVFSFL